MLWWNGLSRNDHPRIKGAIHMSAANRSYGQQMYSNDSSGGFDRNGDHSLESLLWCALHACDNFDHIVLHIMLSLKFQWLAWQRCLKTCAVVSRNS